MRDASHSESLVLQSLPAKTPVDSFESEISGNIDGEAELQLFHGKELYAHRHIAGRFKVKLGGEWYTETAEIRYTPQQVQSGSVSIRYDFSHL